MKTNNKRILSIILALVMILSMLPMVALAATPSKLYLKPNSNWTSAGARFAAYFFGNGEKWVSMTDTDNDGYYEVDVPSGYPKVIFCRMNGSTSANNWNNKWNQTGDLTIPTNGNNCFTVPSGSWDGATTGWSTYTPVVVPVWESPIVNGDSVTFNYWSADNLSSVCVCGTINNWSIGATPMTKGEDGVWTVTVSGLYNGQYEYKFVTNGTDWISDPKNTGAQVGGNNTFQITEGKVAINEPEYTSPVIDGGSVTFNYWRAQEFTSATVYGDMSKDGWATAYPMVKNEETGVWSVTISDLYNGTYEYKIVVDEAWLVDPKNDLIADNGNSMFTITESIDEPELPMDPMDPKYPEIIYLLPNFNWNSDYAAFAAYFYNTDGENAWVSMTDSNGDGVYEAAVPEGMTSVIFCRMDPAAAEPSWDSKWNQSNDLPIPTNGTDLCLMAQGAWDSSSTDAPWADTWATYTEIPVPEFKSPVIDGNSVTFNYWHYGATSVSVHGSMDDWGEGYAMTKGENGLWSVTINDLADALYQYKFVVDDVWILDPANWETYDEYDDEGNIKNQNNKFLLGTPVAEIYSVGVYFTFESAYAAADPDKGNSIILLSDLTVNDLVVDKEMYLDLNGHDLTINAASATATIFVQDSATVDTNSTEYGTLIVNGEATYSALGGYVMLPEAEGHSFHSYSLDITHISLQPGKDALGYKAVLESNSRVLAAVTEIGFEFSVNGGTPVTVKKAVTNANAEFTARLKNIMACGGGEMEITASAFMVVADEALWSNSETTSMKDTIQTVNTMELGDAQKTAVYGLYSQYASVMDAWLGESNNIKSWAPAE